jgi:hypothetical protein
MGQLADAVCKVMAAVGYVQKTGRNDFDRYAYASDADLLKALQPAMAEHGLCMVPVSVVWETSEHRTKKGATEDKAQCVVTYALLHRGGGRIDVQTAGCGTDRMDKAVYKALTGAYKYALRQVFAVPTGDDAEAPAAPGERETPGQKRNRQGAHDPSWEGSRGAFCASLGSMSLSYEAVKQWAVSTGSQSPSTWSQADRNRLLVDLAKNPSPVHAEIRDVMLAMEAGQ